MRLEELYQNLSFGVLSNLAVGDEGSGVIPFKHQSKVCWAVNEALTALYGKFVLQEKEVQVRAYDQMTIYPLKKIYADQDTSVVPQKFIADSVTEPFLEDVVRILDVYDEGGTRLVLNDPTGLGQVYTPNPTTVQIVKPVTGNTYFVMYQARHPKVLADELESIIELPDVLMPALEAYVAYLVLSPMNGQEHAAKAAEHYARYEAICAEALEKDLVGTSVVGDVTKLTDRGWK